MHQLTLRNASEEDVPFFFELRLKSMEPHHAAAGIHQSLEEAMARVRAFLEVAQVVELPGLKVGMIKVTEEPKALRIVQLQLLPEWQGQGIGTSLVRAVLERARAHRLAVALSVLRVNPARRLYERLGFQIIGHDEHSFHMASEA